MNKNIIELQSGKMISIHDIIYVSNIKNKSDAFENIRYYFDVLWANGQKVSVNFDNFEQCRIDWYDLKNAIKKHTESLICD